MIFNERYRDDYSDAEIKTLFSSIETHWPLLYLPVSKTIDRAVRVSDEEKIANVKRLSYCPLKIMDESQKTQYKRCSLPGQEMFYGSLMPDEEDEIEAARIISICESSKLFRTKDNGEELYVFGKWIQQKPLKCMVIVDDKNEYNAQILKEAQKTYAERQVVLTDKQRFLASRFYQSASDHKQYRLSAIYSNCIFSSQEIDAIIYPSVQTQSTGACIAINPRSVDDGTIKLVDALKSKVVMKDIKMHVDIES